MSFPQFAFNNVRRNARAYIAYFLSSAFMVMVFFAYSVFIYHPEIANNDMGPRAATSMQVAAYIVYVFAFFFVLYSISSFLKSRNLEFGILSILGARPGQINKLVFLENMLIGISAIVTGIAGGMLLSKLFLLLSTRTIGIEDLPFYWPIKAMLVTSISFLALFLVISIFTLLFIRKNKVLELLQGNAKPKKQPKASILLSLFGAVLLAVGYFAIRVELTPQSIIIAAVTGIAGTYFFYSQLSVLFIRLLQRNRRTTWRGTRLLWVSEMSYKLRDNSRMLFLITVVTALASMGAGVVLSINQAGRELYTNNPFAITNTYYDTSSVEPDRSVIYHELDAAGVDYTETRIDTLSGSALAGGDQSNYLPLMSLPQYNQLAPLLGLPAGNTLGLNEAILILTKENKSSDYIQNHMITLKEQPAVSLAVKKNIRTDSLGFQSATALLIVPEQWMETLRVAKSAELGHEVQPAVQYLYDVPAWNTGSLPTPSSPESIAGAKLSKWNDDMSGNSGDDFYLESRANNYILLKQSTAMLSFVSIFVALIFSVSSASFLYFKLNSELATDIRMYRALSKIGLSTSEMSAAATKQIAILFYIPIVVSAIQSLVVISPILTEAGIKNIIEPVLITFAAYLILQSLFFLIAKSRYISSLKKMMV
ncbi:ABC transporter permease [Paenibacillus monticola]|uniref:FtsX-like permease family protein n=1 Tax=Paenibacillus monticola TaxID=2666075 RepID=A0A7X2H1I5_9BACL|nr:ABC transporter permease [Paenibacillus monticola]MRN51673.1 FtsX-like permease family protein [Paenibacillus monticola]